MFWVTGCRNRWQAISPTVPSNLDVGRDRQLLLPAPWAAPQPERPYAHYTGPRNLLRGDASRQHVNHGNCHHTGTPSTLPIPPFLKKIPQTSTTFSHRLRGCPLLHTPIAPADCTAEVSILPNPTLCTITGQTRACICGANQRGLKWSGPVALAVPCQ